MAPVVKTSNGALRGASEDGLAVFRGIPFAQPPTGERRFRAPEPAESWEGERDATHFAPASLQVARMVQAQSPLAGMFSVPQEETSEDCLYLNVWTPGLDGARRPVMVWIHGGAFRTGAGSSPMYDGANLARRGDVVVVTVNYRLGALGFLALEELGEANWGVLDQVAALEWVRDEIEAFGGDPSNVTIFGESAGGKSVETLLATPHARGLLHKAIAQSTYDPQMTFEATRPTAEAILGELGIAASEAERLRTLPAEAIVEAQGKVQDAALAEGRPNLGAFNPVIDGRVVPNHPRDVVESGEVAGVPLLVGTTLDEWRLFGAMQPAVADVDEGGLLRRLGAAIPDEAGRRRAVEAYREARAARGEDTRPFALLSAISTDRTFRIHSTQLAEAQSAHQPQTFMYLFTWHSEAWEGKLGACHALELPFVFGTFDTPLGRLAGDSAEAHALSERMQDAWIAFVRSGDPRTGSLPEWPSYEPERRATMLLGRECSVEEGPMEAERRFWEQGRVEMEAARA
jgi:para-nitrobenzyl esterase